MLTNHFFKKSRKKSAKKIENGHFKNVQNGNFQDTFYSIRIFLSRMVSLAIFFIILG
jgi:hypothetical protein